MSLPPRADVQPEYRFDLTQIYETTADWDAAREELLERLSDVAALADEPLETAEALRMLLEAVEACYGQKQRLELYATLSRNVDTGSEAADDRLRRYEALTSTFDPAIAAVHRRLQAADDDQFEALLAGLDEYRFYVENLREQASYARAPDAEDAIAAFDEVRTAPTRIIRAVTTEDYDPPSVERPDGETVEIRPGNRQTELSHRDRDYRRRVYQAYHAELDRFEHTLTRSFAEKLKAAATATDVRGYDSIRDRDLRGGCYPESGLQAALPGAVHDTMLEAVRANLEPYHRALAIRRESLGVESLQPWDLDVSIAGGEPPELSCEAATDHVLTALEPLGEDYVARLRSFLAERRVDVYPTQDKRTDIPAYCPSSAADGAFVLANFRGDVRSTFFLAHELGHAMAVAHHSQGPVRYATTPRPVEEVPSILHELLLTEHFVAEGSDDLAAAARNRLIECIGGNLYYQAMASAFAHRLATAIEAGAELSADRAREVWAGLLAEFRSGVEYDDRAGRNWLGRGTRETYSRYQYVLGAVGALTVRERLRDGTLTSDEYGQFLETTGRRDAVDQFEQIGCDVSSPDPYRRAAEAFQEYVEQADSTT